MVKPFSAGGDNFISILNEIIIIFTFISVYVMNKASFSELTIKVWGWFLIIPIIISLLATWIISLPDAIEEFKKTFTDLFKKEKKPIENKVLNSQAPVKHRHSEERPKKKVKSKKSNKIKNIQAKD